jgi:hypothetical protein
LEQQLHDPSGCVKSHFHACAKRAGSIALPVTHRAKPPAKGKRKGACHTDGGVVAHGRLAVTVSAQALARKLYVSQFRTDLNYYRSTTDMNFEQRRPDPLQITLVLAKRQ